MSHTAVVLAAGKGTRMKSDLPKVMHRIAGRSMLDWVLDAVAETDPDRVVVVVGHGAEQVVESLPAKVDSCVQEHQRGTGDAVATAMDHLGDIDGDVLVVPGDTPLIDGATLQRLVDAHRSGATSATLLTVELPDPHGYGRIVRNEVGNVARIVEQKDAGAEERAIHEINAGMYVFDAGALRTHLSGLGTSNAQGELYLTDTIALAVSAGEGVAAVTADVEAAMGVNTHRHLAEAATIRRARINGALLDAGVAMPDPSSVYIDADATVEPGATILPNVHLEGDTAVRAGAIVGPDTYLLDTSVGERTRIWYSVARQASIGSDAEVGPYVSLRPEAVLMEGSKAGTFVEIKKSTVGRGSKVPHLSYIGDATIGERSNIGAGTITVNYNGFEKARTVVGDGVKIGSDTMLVAPVSVGDGAMTAAGSVITQDIEPDALGIGRSRQVNKPGFAARLAARYRDRSDD